MSISQSVAQDAGGMAQVDLFDGSGNPISSVSGQLLTQDIVTVSSQFRAQSISTTAVQLLGGATILANRKAIFATPTNGTIYVGTSSAVTSANGTPVLSGNTITFSFSTNVQLWAIGLATTDIRVLEVS